MLLAGSWMDLGLPHRGARASPSGRQPVDPTWPARGTSRALQTRMRGFVGAVGLVVACGGSHTPESPVQVIPEDPTFRERTAMLHATLARNGIQLDDEPTIMTCESADAERKCTRCDVATGMDGIDPELVDRVALAIASYPDVLLRAARIERFALCRELRYVGEDDGPVGLAELSKRRIMISVGYFNRGDGRGVEQVVHHEFFHLFDFATLGGAMADREWAALKPRGFEYRDPATGSPPKGFVNAYATTNEIEDRASVYEYMMSAPELCTLAARDPVVAAKVKRLGQRLEAVAGKAFVKKHARCAGGPKPAKKQPVKKPNLALPKRYHDSL